MSLNLPYRAPPEPEVRVDAAPRLTVTWKDTVKSNSWKSSLRQYYRLIPEMIVIAIAAALSRPLGWACVIGFTVYAVVRHRREVDLSFTLDVADGTLRITRTGLATPVRAALSAVRDVEIERKGLERRSDRQQLGPMAPPTEMISARDSARVMVVFDGDLLPLRLSDDYLPVFMCQEHFGKVRTFLRRHGWKPAGEQEEP